MRVSVTDVRSKSELEKAVKEAIKKAWQDCLERVNEMNRLREKEEIESIVDSVIQDSKKDPRDLREDTAPKKRKAGYKK